VLLTDATGKRIDHAHVDLTYDMGMPHGPKTATLQRVGDGVYETDLRFHMAGRWILSFQIEQDAKRHRSAIEIRIPFG
ncbi:MAG: FixH family protein, partial [Actinomycetota bacterium]